MRLASLAANVAAPLFQTNPDILDHLAKDTEWMEQQLDQFKCIADRFDTKFFYETLPLRTLGFSNLVRNAPPTTTAIVRQTC